MLSEERRRAIAEKVQSSGRVLVRNLVEHFHTSSVTIRKDLDILHRRGLIHRTHGGALRVGEGTLVDRSLSEKESLHSEEKGRIAEAAASLVKEGQSIVLDSGSTTTMIARTLRRFAGLTVITNAVNIATELAGTGVEVVLVGGVLVVVCDANKFGRRSLCLIAPVSAIHQVITDTGLSKSDQERLEKAGIKVTLV